MRRGAVVVGGYVNALGLVRSLAARGIEVAVVTTKPFDIAQHSRFAAGGGTAPDVEDRPEQLVELLESRSIEWRGRAVFPTNDATLGALAGAHDRLSSSYTLVAPPAEVTRVFLDKRAMLDMAERVGIALPERHGPATAATAELDLPYPVVVKPVRTFPFASRFGAKLFPARNRGELAARVGAVEDQGIAADVTELVPGGDDRLYAHCIYIDGAGEPRGGLTVHKVRQGPPLYGDARVAEVVPDPPGLREATVELLRAIGHRGIASAEFKHDPRDGSYRFIEVNGRSFVYNALLRRAGVDMTALAWDDHVLGTVRDQRANGWPGAWIHLHPDVLHSAFSRRAQSLSWADFRAPYRGPWMEAVWSARDPAPFAAQWARPPRGLNGGPVRTRL